MMYGGISLRLVQRQSPLNPLETRILLSHALGLSRIELITQSERQLKTEEAATLASLMQRRMNGEPIAYILGLREFYGLSLEVCPHVLIPRPETELLVELAIGHLPPNGRVLDMGTGSGAIAIAIAHTRPDASVTAIDISQAALQVAHRNAQRHKVSIDFLCSNWFATIHQQQFDLIVANPPYIVGGDPHLVQGDLRFEPQDALTDHADGLSALRTIAAGAKHCLATDGWLFMEHGYDQAAHVRELCHAHGFSDVQSWQDLAGIDRVSGGRLENKHP